MEKEKRSRTGTRRTTFAVLEILKTSTSCSNPVSVSELVNRLKVEYEILTHRDSVKDILNDLMEYYPGPDRILCMDSKKGRPYQYDYYYQSEIPVELQKSIQKIECVIRKNRNSQDGEYRISFGFSGYGSDHELHPTDGEIRDVLPVRIVQAYGHYYLVGLFREKLSASHYRIDLMRQIRECKTIYPDREKRRFRINEIMEADYTSAHLHMAFEQGESPRQIRLRVKKIDRKPNASLTILQDAFGSNWRPVSGTETEAQVEVYVKCLPYAIKLFVRQYIDRVRVLEPEDIAREVEDDLKREFQAYFSDYREDF